MNGVDVIGHDPDDIYFYYYTQPSLQTISPFVGSIEGGSNVTVSGNYFGINCGIKVRFATSEVNGTLHGNDQINVTSPPQTCPGETVVQVALNGQ